MILLCILSVLKNHISLRACPKVINSFFSIILPDYKSWIPSPTSICRWIKRVGLFKLKCALPQASDWIGIGDCSIGIGVHKVILVLGIRLSSYLELVAKEQALTLSDVVPLQILIVETCNGEAVCDAFKQAEARVGQIKQFCIDGGADMQKGAALFKKEALKINPERTLTITYDTPHKTGCLLKQQLDNNPRWHEFITHANNARLKAQQTKLAYLAPPNQRSKCRYMNIDQITSWSQKALMLFDMQDRLQKGSYAFVQVKKCESDSDNPLVEIHSQKISELCTIESNSEEDFIQLSTEEYKAFLNIFGWLNEYREDIGLFSRYALVAATVRDEVRRHGLHVNSHKILDERLFALSLNKCEKAYNFCRKCLDFIESATEGLQEGELLLGSDEVIESLFGLMKSLLDEDAKRGLTSYVLAATAACGPLDEELIAEAFQMVKDKDVKEWSRTNLSKTYLSKRRYIFKAVKTAMSEVEKMKNIFNKVNCEKTARAVMVYTKNTKAVFRLIGQKVAGIIWRVCEKIAA